MAIGTEKNFQPLTIVIYNQKHFSRKNNYLVPFLILIIIIIVPDYKCLSILKRWRESNIIELNN